MKQVVIEMKDGVPFVKYCPKKVEVIIRHEKKKTLKKRYRTLVYKLKTFVGIQ